MRFSKALVPTLREAPAEATQPSHVLLLRAGYIRQVGAGLYELLPLGLRVLRRVESVVREEMDAAGAQELLLPALLPSDYFKESGRFAPDTGVGEILFRISDRKGGEYHLGPTHEEIITDLARRELKSYKQLPQLLYQVQSKYRDEARPRGGLLRSREFLMKDAYSFDADEEAARASYERMRAAYKRIFERLGLRYRIVRADAGGMGGSVSAEFQILAQQGEDAIIACRACDYAANVEVAGLKPPASRSEGHAGFDDTPIEKLHTPGAGGIDDVVAHLGGGLTPKGMLKCILYRVQLKDEVIDVMAVVRGDREVNEIKLARALDAVDLTMATPEQVQVATGAAVGFAGPVGFSGRIVADYEVPSVLDAVTGANETDHHLRGVNFDRDFEAELVDLRSAEEGDACPSCGSPVHAYRAIEGGHIFLLGTHYSQKMRATFLDQNGKAKPLVMGCYGIGVSRILAAAVEQNHDDKGIMWPLGLAPYEVVVVPIGKDDEVKAKAEEVYATLKSRGLSVALDDRAERPGVKFADAELIGMPFQIRLGSRGLKEGQAEFFERKTGETSMVPLSELEEVCVRRVRLVEGGHAA